MEDLNRMMSAVQLNQLENISSPSVKWPAEVGTKITGFVVHVEDPEVCYIHLEIDGVEKLRLMNDELNFLVKSHQLEFEANQNLMSGDLVTALYENLWFRAQVVDVIRDQIYYVRYVDYGNGMLITKKELRKWCSKFDHFPFFAKRVRISNVQTNQHRVNNAMQFLRNFLESSNNAIRPIGIKVISIHPEETAVILTDCDGCDIGEEMIFHALVDRKF